MTDSYLTSEELDQARITEAYRIVGMDNPVLGFWSQAIIDAYRKLVRANWIPSTSVPDDLLRAREIMESVCGPYSAPGVKKGAYDKDASIIATRIALYDPTFVIPTEVDDEMMDAWNAEWDKYHPLTDATAAGILAVLNIVRDRATKNMEAMG